MQTKGQMTMTKLSLLLFGLTVIWILCSRAELQLAQRFQDEDIARMGGQSIDSQKLRLALTIKNGKTQQQRQKAVTQLDQILSKTYKLSKTHQQTICIVIRDFQTQDTKENNYSTLKSIMNQKYNKYHIIYLSDKKDLSRGNIQNYLSNNQIIGKKYNFVSVETDTLEALFLVGEECPRDGIILMIENQQVLITSNALAIINEAFQTKNVEFTWGTSLYKNDKLGFSFPYSKKIVQLRTFKLHPFPANDVIAFRNDLFQRNRRAFMQFRLVNPLWMSQSYGNILIQKALNFKYIPQILSIKNNKSTVIRKQRSQLQKQIEYFIRNDISIIPFLTELKKSQP